jgi:CO/xanthine dehydrogenase Mo-binding subunit
VAALKILGRSIPRIEGPEKVTGAARFAADVELPGMLWGKLLRSPHPHARIKRIDLSPALKLPGVVAALSGRDVPNVRTGKTLKDIPVLCSDVVRYVGDPIAAVAAESPDLAEEALGLIEVEYEELPIVRDPESAMRPEAPRLHPDYDSYQGASELPSIPNLQAYVLTERGDPEVGFAEADRVFEHTFRINRVHQAFLEPRACVVQLDEAGMVNVWSSCKVPFALRNSLANLLDLPPERVVVRRCKIGGDFGGKNSIGPEPIAYWLARESGRPVKFVNSYVEELQSGAPRHGGSIAIKTGVKRDGTLTVREVKVVFNGGAYAGNRAAPNLAMPSVVKAPGPYRIPHVRVEQLYVYTNTLPGGIMRAPGQPQVMFASETQLSLIAQALGIDPLELRLRNVVEEGDPRPTGESQQGVNGRLTLETARAASGWNSPLAPNRGRGIALSERAIGSAPSGLTLRLSESGAVTAISGIPDVGTGAFTILKAVVAEHLQIPFEAVEVVEGDTESALFDSGIGGSKTTYSSNHSATETTTELKRRLAEAAAERLECDVEDIEFVDGAFRVKGHPGSGLPILELGAEVAAAEGGLLEVQAPGPNERPPQPCFVANVVEAEIDPETGQVDVLKVTAAHDVGFVINPQLLQAQIDGATVQGLGFALMEEIPIGDDGRPSVSNFGDYKIPNSADVPELSSVFIEGAPGPGPFGAKAVGELSLTVLAPALAGAVLQATGLELTENPITAERVYAALARRRSGES